MLLLLILVTVSVTQARSFPSFVQHRRPFNSVTTGRHIPTSSSPSLSILRAGAMSEPPSPPSSSSGAYRTFAVAFSVCVGITQLLAYGSTLGVEGFHQCSSIAWLSLFIQGLGFIYAGGLFGNERTEKFYDLTGSFTYMATIILSGLQQNTGLSLRQKILSAFGLIWCSRLGSFLFQRINRHKGIDSRFTEIKKSLLRFYTAWNLQGVWVFITALPIFALNVMNDTTPLQMMDYCGMAIWAFGFIFEVVSDEQKKAFAADPVNKDKHISKGLWALSRHPK